MSAGWQVGDLAVCVDASDQRGLGPDGPRALVEGKIYRVADLRFISNWAGGIEAVGLFLEGCLKPSGSGAWIEIRFRKVEPDRHEECEEEFRTLLKRSKQPVPTEARGIASEVSSVGGLK